MTMAWYPSLWQWIASAWCSSKHLFLVRCSGCSQMLGVVGRYAARPKRHATEGIAGAGRRTWRGDERIEWNRESGSTRSDYWEFSWHLQTPTWLVHLRSSMPIARTVASTIAHEHCTTLLNHHHLRHWSPRWKPISPPKPVSSMDQSASGAVQRSVGSSRSVGWSQGNTVVPVPHSRIQVERESLLRVGGHCTIVC